MNGKNIRICGFRSFSAVFAYRKEIKGGSNDWMFYDQIPMTDYKGFG
jgi:hypothetical protein